MDADENPQGGHDANPQRGHKGLIRGEVISIERIGQTISARVAVGHAPVTQLCFQWDVDHDAKLLGPLMRHLDRLDDITRLDIDERDGPSRIYGVALMRQNPPGAGPR